MTKNNIAEFFRRLAAARPEPQTELSYANPFTLLVAVVLSAQATDVGVNKATATLFPIVDTPQKMLELGEERLREAIRTIGLYRTKASNVIKLSAILIEQYGGKVPRDR
jgi:endonuclease III